MTYPLCRHVRTNGLQCKSPALTGRPFCFYHHRLYDRHSGFHHTAATRAFLVPGQHIELDPLEDRDSVQLALSLVINALATGQLETRRATAILYGLQLASQNAANLRHFTAHDTVRAIITSPEGLDLAHPGAFTQPPIPFAFDDEDEDEDDDYEEATQPTADEAAETVTGA